MTNKNCDVNLPATVLVYKRYLLSSKNSATKRNSVKKLRFLDAVSVS